MKKVTLAGAMMVALGAGSVQAADDFNNIAALALFPQGQDMFLKLSEDLAAATSYKALSPVEALGITGLDLGVEVTDTSLQYSDYYAAACGGCTIDNLYLPKVHLHKGLPFGLDVGVMRASDSNSNVTLTGVELRYALVDGGIAKPAVAARLTYSVMDGVDEMDLETTGLELGISKGFAILTPYAGVGQNWVTSTPKGTAASAGLLEEEFTQTKAFVGVNINLGLLNIDVEMDDIDGTKTMGAKLGFRF